jgi:hypothetical protein
MSGIPYWVFQHSFAVERSEKLAWSVVAMPLIHVIGLEAMSLLTREPTPEAKSPVGAAFERHLARKCVESEGLEIRIFQA